MVHSSYNALGPVEGGAESVVDAILEAVGSEGTVLFPTFDFHSWTENHYFDIRETTSKMGIITELARLRKEAVRTPHPIYPFAVIGKLSGDFAGCHGKAAFGRNSAFELFHKLNGLVISIGVRDLNNTFTVTHYAEAKLGCDYRRPKPFSGIYVGPDGRAELKTYSMSVRCMNVETDMEPALEHLKKEGVIRESRLGNTFTHITHMNEFYERMAKLVKEEPDKLRIRGAVKEGRLCSRR